MTPPFFSSKEVFAIFEMETVDCSKHVLDREPSDFDYPTASFPRISKQDAFVSAGS